MAVVDFSKAKISDYTTGEGGSPFRTTNLNLGVNFYKKFPYKDSDGKERTRTTAQTINSDGTFTQHKGGSEQDYIFSGVFTDSGTSFVIMANNSYQGWLVSNISFSKGDIYCFAITINVPSA